MIKISTNKAKLNIDYIYQYLINSYWASDRTLGEVKKSIQNSLCFGIYLNEKQIGFARIVTDKIVFSYLMDVFIDNEHQGKKYGQLFLKEIYKHPDLKNVKNNYLHTKDAQSFYKKLGFKVYKMPNKHMVKYKDD